MKTVDQIARFRANLLNKIEALNERKEKISEETHELIKTYNKPFGIGYLCIGGSMDTETVFFKKELRAGEERVFPTPIKDLGPFYESDSYCTIDNPCRYVAGFVTDHRHGNLMFRVLSKQGLSLTPDFLSYWFQKNNPDIRQEVRVKK